MSGGSKPLTALPIRIQEAPMPDPKQPMPTPPPSDVLQAGPHQQLSSEEVAKAIARHKREHPPEKPAPAKPKKHR